MTNEAEPNMANMLSVAGGDVMTKDERAELERLRRLFARLQQWRKEVQPLLDEDLERAAEESRRIEARALRQLRRGY